MTHTKSSITGIVVAFFIVLSFGTAHAFAISALNFNAANIISDGVFTDANTMSPNVIQDFLNSKVPTCDTNGTQSAADWGYPNLTHAQFATRIKGWPGPPYTCLKDYQVNGVSAAQFIYNTAQQHNINPQVLIVTLQKESALITDTWPLPSQYRTATGYGCPDTAACDSQYFGIANQLTWAARLYHAVEIQSSTWATNYFVGTQDIRWSPNSSCGSGQVNVQNWSTVALYTYTPYQPNQAALNAGYGIGDGCSAYGNRNFYLYFGDWFGSPQYQASYASQSAYPTIAPGSSQTVSITYKNTGSQSWYDDVTASQYGRSPMHLGTANPGNRASDFGSTWGTNRDRPAGSFSTVYDTYGNVYATNPHIVKSGESATFTFTLSTPNGYRAGTYRESFAPLIEGNIGYVPASGVYLDVTVTAVPSATFVSQSDYPTITAGTSKSAYFTYKNTGNAPWRDDRASSGTRVHLQTNPTSRVSIFGSTWPTANTIPTTRIAAVYNSDGTTLTSDQTVVNPGQIGKFSLTLTAPDNQAAGNYNEAFTLQDQTNTDIPGTYAWLSVAVPTQASARTTTQTSSQITNPTQTGTATYSYTNTGNTTWTQGSTSLVISSGNATSYNSNWTTGTVIASLNESSVPPGDTGTFTLSYFAPFTKTDNTFTVIPSISGATLQGTGTQAALHTPAPANNLSYYSQSSYPTVQQGSNTSGYFMFKNTGNAPLYDSSVTRPNGAHSVSLATSHDINRFSIFGTSSWWGDRNRPTTLFTAVYKADGQTLAVNQHIAQPGEIIKMQFTFTASQSVSPGTYREWFQPIIEGGNPWNMGAQAFLDVTVTPGVYSATWRDQSDYPTISRGKSAQLYLKYENSGSAIWYNSPSAPEGLSGVNLATTNPINRSSIFLTSNRPATTFAKVYEHDGSTLAADQTIAKPGQVVEFDFTATAPADAGTGTYREWFQPIIEGGNPWNMGAQAFLDVTVN